MSWDFDKRDGAATHRAGFRTDVDPALIPTQRVGALMVNGALKS